MRVEEQGFCPRFKRIVARGRDFINDRVFLAAHGVFPAKQQQQSGYPRGRDGGTIFTSREESEHTVVSLPACFATHKSRSK